MPNDWEICDVFGFGPDELAIVPRPVASVIMLFPYNEAVRIRWFLINLLIYNYYLFVIHIILNLLQYEKRKHEEELKLKDKGQQVSDDIYFVKQFVHNACGTMALIHSVANNRDK